MVLSNVYQLKHIQLTKLMHYCIPTYIPRVPVEVHTFQRIKSHDCHATKTKIHEGC